MSFRQSTRVVGIVLSFLSGCSGERAPTPVDSAAVTPGPAAPVVAPAINPGWNAAAGPVLILPPAEGSTAAPVILPEVTDSILAASTSFSLDSLISIPVELFNRQGKVGESTLGAMVQRTATDLCPSWPQVSLAGKLPVAWKVGFVKGRMTGIPLDSLERMSVSDSAAVTQEIVRLASQLPGTSDPVFQGLPFSVPRVFRFVIGPTSVLVANVIRKINQEANPLEEHVLLIAERRGGLAGAYRQVFHSRATGLEDVVQTNEVLAGFQIVETGRSEVAINMEREDGGRIAMLERGGAGEWKIRWRSAYAGC